MFTLQQMKAAHAKVKTGADFPHYVQEIKALGLKRYIYSVTDGTTTYYGEDGYQVSGPAIYEPKVINPDATPEKLRHFIAIYQQGQTDFLTLCEQVATAGVRQWVVDAERMLCLYEDSDGKEMVVEPVPDAGY